MELPKLPKVVNSEHLGGYGGFGSTDTGNIEKNIIDIAEVQAESRRKKVLNMLTEKPESERAYVTDTTIDPDNVILTIAIRDLATFEMLIPKDKYDPFMLMKLISEGVVQ